LGTNVLVKRFILLGSIFYLTSCMKVENPKERNRLVFADDVASVADSMRVLDSMLLGTYKRHYIYAVDGGYLYVTDNELNVVKIGLLSDSALYQSPKLSCIDLPDRKRFISLIRFLKRNFLLRCDVRGFQPEYLYRDDIYMADWQTDLKRKVILLRPEERVDTSRFKVLDVQYDLYLLADKDARVWSSD